MSGWDEIKIVDLMNYLVRGLCVGRTRIMVDVL